MKIAIIGLGYVGIQLAVGFGRTHSVIGMDLDAKKVADYQAGYDSTGEVSRTELRAADLVHFTTQPSDLCGCEVFIVAVPTPVDSARNPDFGPLLRASRTVGSVMAPGSTVVYESTVYPGATEEVCVPELESAWQFFLFLLSTHRIIDAGLSILWFSGIWTGKRFISHGITF